MRLKPTPGSYRESPISLRHCCSSGEAACIQVARPDVGQSAAARIPFPRLYVRIVGSDQAAADHIVLGVPCRQRCAQGSRDLLPRRCCRTVQLNRTNQSSAARNHVRVAQGKAIQSSLPAQAGARLPESTTAFGLVVAAVAEMEAQRYPNIAGRRTMKTKIWRKLERTCKRTAPRESVSRSPWCRIRQQSLILRM